MTVTTSYDLLLLAYQALLGTTAAADKVFKPGDWPSQEGQYPLIKMSLPLERRVANSRSGAPDFTTTPTIRIIGEVSAPAKVGDAGASDAEIALWALKRQIEVAIVNSYPLTSKIQHIPTITSQLDYSSDAATHLAGIRIDIALEFYEGPESFAPVESDDLQQVTIANTNLPPTGLSVDLPT